MENNKKVGNLIVIEGGRDKKTTANKEGAMEIVKSGKPKSASMEKDKARKIAVKICRVVENAFDPLRIIDTAEFGECVGEETLDFYEHMEELERVVFPRIHKARAKYEAIKDGQSSENLDDTVWEIAMIRGRTQFIVGCLFGMRMAGGRMDEIERTARLIVARQIREFRPNDKDE